MGEIKELLGCFGENCFYRCLINVINFGDLFRAIRRMARMERSEQGSVSGALSLWLQLTVLLGHVHVQYSCLHRLWF